MLAANIASAQEPFFPMKEGTVVEYEFKDAKGRALRDQWRAERWMRLNVEQVWGDTLANVHIENQELERLGKFEQLVPIIADLQYGDVLSTKTGVSFDNVQWYFSPVHQIFSYMRDDGRSYTPEDERDKFHPVLSTTSHLPRGLKAGDTLPDEQIKVLYEHTMGEKKQARMREVADEINVETQMEGRLDFKMPDRFDLTVTGSITDRRVEGQEKVQTTAGEFECWKIAYNIVGPKHGVAGLPDKYVNLGDEPMGGNPDSPAPPTITPMIDYVSPLVGLVRRETLSDNCKKVVEVMEMKRIN